MVAQEVTLGGKGSVTYPSLNVGPGEAFQVRIDMQLMRPSQITGGPLVQVDLDGVLFQDLSFFGPDRLNSRRTMTACEMEAQRDREHFKRVLAQGGRDGLQREMLESMARQSDVSQLTVRVKRDGRAVTSAATGPEHDEEFAFLQFPDSPVEPMKGSARISGNEARAPRIEVRNKSNRPVKYVEMGWIVSDPAGRQYMAGSLPSSDTDLVLPPGQSARVLQETTLELLRQGPAGERAEDDGLRQPGGIRRRQGVGAEPAEPGQCDAAEGAPAFRRRAAPHRYLPQARHRRTGSRAGEILRKHSAADSRPDHFLK